MPILDSCKHRLAITPNLIRRLTALSHRLTDSTATYLWWISLPDTCGSSSASQRSHRSKRCQLFSLQHLAPGGRCHKMRSRGRVSLQRWILHLHVKRSQLQDWANWGVLAIAEWWSWKIQSNHWGYHSRIVVWFITTRKILVICSSARGILKQLFGT